MAHPETMAIRRCVYYPSMGYTQSETEPLKDVKPSSRGRLNAVTPIGDPIHLISRTPLLLIYFVF